MIIRSIRLKNIKCYGEGPDGNGVTIRFEPGINRIAGKNGHGKSTLIESLGYALFLTEPVYEESFEAATYLLRAGKKAGEIDVTFDYAGRLYRLERGVGQQNKRRPKVVLAEDGSTEAEGETEVCDYLCRLFGFANPERFSELFSKLVGVKQGRLTWPFDSKPTEARKHFEPLLDVEIFRQCFNELKPVLDHFDALKQEHEQSLAVVQERLRERADSPEKAPAAEQQVAALEATVNAARAEKAQADRQAQIHEEKERIRLEAGYARDAAGHQLKLAAGHREAGQTRLAESEQACQTLAATQSGYEAFATADQALRGLQDKQREKSALVSRHAAAATAKTEWEGQARAARDQVKERTREKESAELRARELRQQAAAGEQAWRESRPEFEALAQSANAARQAGEALNHWLGALAPAVAENTRRLAKIMAAWNQLAAWDPHALDLARAGEAQAEKAATEITRRLAEARQLRATLAGQLEQITGGVCPFLKEQCRQFDPAKIGADLAGHKKEIDCLAREQAAAEQARQQARALRENLSQQEARLAPLRAALRDQAEAYIQAHHQLYPPAIQEHFHCLRDYLRTGLWKIPRLSGRAGELLPLPAESASGPGVPPLGGETFNPASLQEMDEAAGAFCRQARAAIEVLTPELAERLAQFKEQHNQRIAQERDWQNQRRQALEAEANAGALAQKIAQQAQTASRAEAEIAAAAACLQDLEARLAPYASLETEVQAQQNLKDQFEAPYRQYLGAKPNAEKLAERQAAFAQACEAERHAGEQARLKQMVFEAAQAAFDPAALAAARKAAEDAGQRLAGESVRWRHAQQELAREQQRLAEWRQASRQQDILRLKLDRLRASLAVTQKARYVLRDAAPLVAQRVCRRIAAKAQRIFNQINPEPVELEWSADRYSLRIDPGDRRFAMLSGGEQTKLALAMTLAMIQEFSRLKCCVFDEPTYGVDADSRQKLADAIVALQDLTEHRLDQLLLVSHDDAFEGKIEHGIVLKKVAGTGTEQAALH